MICLSAKIIFFSIFISAVTGKSGSKVSVRCDNNDPKPFSNSLKTICPNVTTKISLSGLLPTIQKDFANDWKQLKQIDISALEVSKIQPEAFKNLPKLSNLNLRDNKIRELKSETFANLESVSDLNLRDNHIAVLNQKAFRNLSSLGRLGLDHNNLTHLSVGVFDNAWPDYLHLEYNRISKIDSGFFDIEECPKESVCHNQKLKEVYIRGNHLEEISSDVFTRTGIVILDLSENRISYIEENAFANMDRLESINLEKNALSTWKNDWFGALTKAKIFKFGSNSFEEIPKQAFKSFSDGFSINFESNNIKKIEQGAFKDVHKVGKIDFKDNKLESLNEEFFLLEVDNMVDLTLNEKLCELQLNETVLTRNKIFYKPCRWIPRYSRYPFGSFRYPHGPYIRLKK